MSSLDEAVNKFHRALDGWREGYTHGLLNYVLLRSTNGLQLLAARILADIQPITQPLIKLDTASIVAGQLRLDKPLERLNEIVGQLSRKKIEIDGYEIGMSNDQGLVNAHCFPIWQEATNNGFALPLLRIDGGHAPQLSEEHDWELRSHKEPFNGVQELLLLLGLAPPMSATASLSVMPLPVVRIDANSSIVNNIASLRVRMAQGIRPEAFRLGLRILSNNQVNERLQLPSTKFTWTMEDGQCVGVTTVQVPDKSIVQAIATVGGRAHHQYWLTDPNAIENPRAITHSALDSELGVLGELLTDQKKRDSRRFESGIAYLLHLLGFSAINYVAPLDDAPDIVAISPMGKQLLIECTTSAPDNNGKLSKLHGRTERIRKALIDAQLGYFEVIPVLVSALPRSEIEADITRARSLNVAVLAREDIESLLRRVRWPVNPDGLIEEYRRQLVADSDGEKQENLLL